MASQHTPESRRRPQRSGEDRAARRKKRVDRAIARLKARGRGPSSEGVKPLASGYRVKRGQL